MKSGKFFSIFLIFVLIFEISLAVPARPKKKAEGLCGYKDLTKEERKKLPVIDVIYSDEVNNSTFESEQKRQTSTGWPAGWNTIRIYVDVGRIDPNNPIDTSSCYPTSSSYINDNNQQAPCTDNLRITSALRNTLVGDLIPKAITILKRSLAVRPIADSLNLPSTVCGVDLTRTSPTYCSGNTCRFPNIDLVLVAKARPILQEGVLARAGPCAFESTGRAVAGDINFNPPTINNDKYGFPQSLGTAVHEISHILGFNFDSLDEFWDGTKKIPKEQVYKVVNFPTPAGTTRPIYKVISPNVVAEARAHFGCATVDGMELENYPLSGTNGSHWELRTAGNEYMVGLSQIHPVFSRLTLAFFLDSGWYKVNMSAASQLEWGYQQGCDFVQKNCNSWSTDLYWCSKPSATSCNYDRTAKSICYLQDYPSDIDPQYRYYPDPKAGGDQFADYCSYYVPVNLGNGNGPIGDCTNVTNGLTTGGVLGTRSERWGPNSRCFDNTLLLGATGVADLQQGCYSSLCVNGGLKIKIGQYWYDCPLKGSISPTGYGGSLTCPSINSLCGGNSDLDPSLNPAFATAIGNYGPSRLLWPKIISIDPASGGPGTEITINGTNFLTNMTGVILKDASCTYVSSTTYKCVVADQSTFDQLKNIKVGAVDVILYSPDTQQSAVLPLAFVLDADLGNIFNIAGRWMKRNPGPTAGIFAGAAILFGIAIYFCVRESRKTRKGRNPNVNV
eukprot:TRINITY_DN13758_c0_g1_i1.p1 TRINITY_DN13758_c0_g1~~TRINITY_DN13758_c0_g1_i1.p1  ORF type:complete len:729 (-),score=214.48 TRINITY_DN13758_c0_g1_i1:98-2284(-)